jgi:hypothetical protein
MKDVFRNGRYLGATLEGVAQYRLEAGTERGIAPAQRKGRKAHLPHKKENSYFFITSPVQHFALSIFSTSAT